jgi:hypothetical protein
MPDEPNNSDARAVARGYESKNPPAGWVVLAAATVPLMIAGCFLAAGIILAFWTKSHPLDASIRVRGTVVAPGIEPLTRFPKPNLELSPHTDFAALHSHEDAELTNYGWIDRTKGVVQIPIDRAIELIAQRGLPFRASNAPVAVGPSELQLSRSRSQSPQP